MQLSEREGMVLLHLPQVRLVAKRIWDRVRFAVELDDLIGFGMIGLLHAVERFDPSRGILLKTYAEHRIRGAILDGLRKMDWLPRSARKKERREQMAQRERESQDAAAFGLRKTPALKPQQGLEAIPPPRHAPAGVPHMELVFAGGSLGDLERLAESKGRHRNGANDPETLYGRKEECRRVARATARLPRRHREVIELYYGRELSMKQIGEILCVHESRVSQLHSAAIHRMRTLLSEDAEPSGPCTNEPVRRYGRAIRPRSSKYRETASQSSSVSTPMVSSEVSAT
ncbi:MAG TPA: sigma-70 family RNA polymerase sigma factor [Terriglobia bacterium]